jgi:hypothetical protein
VYQVNTCRVKNPVLVDLLMPIEEYRRPYHLENDLDRIDTFSIKPYSHRNHKNNFQFDIEHIPQALDDSLDCICMIKICLRKKAGNEEFHTVQFL